MREWLEQTFGVRVLRWAEWDGEQDTYECLLGGKVILTDSLPLLIRAITEGRGWVLPAQASLAA